MWEFSLRQRFSSIQIVPPQHKCQFIRTLKNILAAHLTAFRHRSRVTGIESAVICDRNVFNSSESADNGPNFDDSSESDLRISSQDQTTVRARPPPRAKLISVKNRKCLAAATCSGKSKPSSKLGCSRGKQSKCCEWERSLSLRKNDGIIKRKTSADGDLFIEGTWVPYVTFSPSGYCRAEYLNWKCLNNVLIEFSTAKPPRRWLRGKSVSDLGGILWRRQAFQSLHLRLTAVVCEGARREKFVFRSLGHKPVRFIRRSVFLQH